MQKTNIKPKGERQSRVIATRRRDYGASAVKSDRGSQSKLRNCLLGRGDVSPIIKILEYLSIFFSS